MNVNFPNSATVPFHTETEFLLQEGVFNTSPFLHELPFVFPEVEVPITYHPIPIDAEGHRLEYKLITPLQGDGWIVPNYLFPDELDPGIENNYQFDTNTGLSRWSSPQRTGDYLVAFRIEEYDESGLFLSSTILPVYFKVTEIGHIMPTVTPDSLTVTVPNLPADVVLNIEANATDQLVLFEGYSELLENGAATFTASPDFEFGPVVEQFMVSAGVDLARSYPYYLILRAGDDYSAEQSGVAFEVVKLAFGDLLSTNGPLASTMELGVFPNPATDFLNVGWNKALTEGARLEVWQTDGRIVLHQPLDPGQRALELPVSEWPRGMYWLVVRS
ncbi:MAG: T9SS type A sorting domain-containing protein, partial [Bacteroidota bacterium]